MYPQFVSRCDCGERRRRSPPKLNSRGRVARTLSLFRSSLPAPARGGDAGSAGHQINMANFVLPKTVSGLVGAAHSVGLFILDGALTVPKIKRIRLRLLFQEMN